MGGVPRTSHGPSPAEPESTAASALRLIRVINVPSSTFPRPNRPAPGLLFRLIGSLLLLFVSSAHGNAAERVEREPTATVYEQWGVEVLSLEVTAAGYMLDFRYRLLDPERARPVFDKKADVFLLDEKTGAKLRVPTPPKIGSMRQWSPDPKTGRVFTILFANPGRFVKRGGKVTVVIGDVRFEHIIVR